MSLSEMAATSPDSAAKARVAIGFVNWAHALDHYVMLIFPTVVIGLEAIYQRPYSELIALGTASFAAFGVFSLPAGWLADRWSRRNMMALFYIGCGVSLAVAGLSPNFTVLAVALFALGVFAAIYHPVGTAMLIEKATSRGRSLAFNGVCGNLGVAITAGVTAALVAWFGWRTAFFVPAAVCIVTGLVFLKLVPNDVRRATSGSNRPDVRLAAWIALAVFGLFVVVATTSGLVFQIATIALPKIVDERVGVNVPLIMVGGIATAVFLCGAFAQLAIGRLVERYPPHLLFGVVAMLEFAGIAWAVYAAGVSILIALAIAMAAIYAQVTLNDLIIARYTADAWRGRAYAVRYFLSFLTAAVAVGVIAYFHARGGFDLVLVATAIVALAFLVATMLIVLLVNGVERERAQAAAPAE